MTDTVTAPSAGDLVDGLPDGLRGLDSDAVVGLIVDQRAAADRMEALLAGVVHYVDLHPVVGEFVEPAVEVLPASGPVGMLPPTVMPVSSAGVPEVTQDAAAALAAALGITYGSVCALISDALQLAYRLPRLWGLVQDGRLQAWRARRVAQHTRTLPATAAAYVDRHVAVTAVHNRVPVNLGAVAHQALRHCDPGPRRRTRTSRPRGPARHLLLRPGDRALCVGGPDRDPRRARRPGPRPPDQRPRRPPRSPR